MVDTNTVDFENIYKLVEETAIDYDYEDIAQLFQKLRDKMHVEGNSDLEKRAQWEIDFFSFEIQKNVSSPKWVVPSAEGKIINRPTYDTFTDTTYEYLVNRFNLTANPMIKARYAHILWLSPRKHGKYAVVAIKSYFSMLKLLEEKEKQTENQLGFQILNAIENAYYLSKNLGDKIIIELAKSEIKRLIFGFNVKSSLLFKLRADLMELMIGEKAIFSNEDYSGVAELCITFSKQLNDCHQSITILELGEKVEQRTKATNHNWRDLIAQSYESLMRTYLVKDKHLAKGFCQQALENYKISKNNSKVEELEKIYITLKGSVEFKKVEAKFDRSVFIKKCQKDAQEIAQKYSSEEIIEILMTDKSLLPEYKKTLDFAQQILAEHPIQTIFHRTLNDEQGHVAQHFVSKEEIEYYELLHQYRMRLEGLSLPFIYLIIKEAVAQKKLTYQSIMEYFANKAWFGKTFARKIQNQNIPYNWLNLLAPPLFDYFQQMDYHYATQEYPNLILCIDSLALKVEGLLRDLLQFSGVTTFYSTQDIKKRTIYREKDVNSLLHENKVKELFEADDLLLFKFVLVEKAGYNLRHKIAHALIFVEEYRIEYFNLLLLILLRIARYDVKIAQNSGEEQTIESESPKKIS